VVAIAPARQRAKKPGPSMRWKKIENRNYAEDCKRMVISSGKERPVRVVTVPRQSWWVGDWKRGGYAIEYVYEPVEKRWWFQAWEVSEETTLPHGGTGRGRSSRGKYDTLKEAKAAAEKDRAGDWLELTV
jgi:hypothetical protein